MASCRGSIILGREARSAREDNKIRASWKKEKRREEEKKREEKRREEEEKRAKKRKRI